MISGEVMEMSEEHNVPESIPEEQPGYAPRPIWQVWLARVGLVAFLIFLFIYYMIYFGGIG